MSTEAPWIAVAIDWQDSEMFDDSPHGERLAWICLLCFAKAQGRAGKVRFRGKAFAERYRLGLDSVEAMVKRATEAGALEVEGDTLSVVNWRRYQDPRVRTSSLPKHLTQKEVKPKSRRFSKSAENDATPHHPPPTHNPPPPPSWKGVGEVLSGLGMLESRQACEEARRSGVSPADVLELVDFWKSHPGAWGVAALRLRIGIAQRKMPVDVCWPVANGASVSPDRPPEYRRVDRAIFDAHAKAGDFMQGPYADPPGPDGKKRIFGTLKGGRKIESSA